MTEWRYGLRRRDGGLKSEMGDQFTSKHEVEVYTIFM
jgi:hypothetical protein